jgi:hypothetical protein
MTLQTPSFQKTSRRLLGVVAAVLLSTSQAHCYNFNPTNYDLILGLQQPSGSYEMIVNIGSVSNYLKVPAGSTISITNYSTNFLGRAFSDINDVQWSVLGAVATGAASSSHPAKTCWMTEQRSDPNTQSTPWIRYGSTIMGGPMNEILAIGNGPTIVGPSDTNYVNETGVILSLNDPFGYSIHVDNQLSGTWTGSVEGTTPDDFDGSGGVVRCDFYEVQPSQVKNLPAKYLGYFDFHSDGTMTYTAASGAAAPSAPTGITAVATNNAVMVSWTPSTGATNYNVKRSLSGTGTFTTVGTAAGTNYTDTSVVDGTTYYYEVTAVGSGLESGTSPVSPAVTPWALPLRPELTATTNNQVSFPSESGVTYVLLGTNAAGLSTPIAQWPQIGASKSGTGNAMSFTVTPGVSNAFYVIRASR